MSYVAAHGIKGSRHLKPARRTARQKTIFIHGDASIPPRVSVYFLHYNHFTVNRNHFRDVASRKGRRAQEITSIVDRVGTGDSFAAGLIYGLQE
jgi:hypothetical protein